MLFFEEFDHDIYVISINPFDFRCRKTHRYQIVPYICQWLNVQMSRISLNGRSQRGINSTSPFSLSPSFSLSINSFCMERSTYMISPDYIYRPCTASYSCWPSLWLDWWFSCWKWCLPHYFAPSVKEFSSATVIWPHANYKKKLFGSWISSMDGRLCDGVTICVQFKSLRTQHAQLCTGTHLASE